MPISVQTPIIEHAPNGVTTVFAYPFAILAEEDLKATLDGTAFTAFTVSGVGSRTGGSITCTSAPTGSSLIIYRDVSLDRATDYQELGDLLAETLDDDFDRVWMALQDQLLIASRAIRAPLGESFDELPAAASRALRVLGFDASGAPIMLTRTDDGGSALALDLLDTTSTSKASGMMAHLAPGGGANEITVRERLNKVIFSGEYDSLQEAIDAALADNLPLYIEGANTITEKLDLSGLRLVEFLPNASITESSSSTITSGDAIIYVNDSTGFTLRGHGRKITGYRRGSGTSDIVYGIGLYGCTDTRISDLDIYDCAGDGWHIAPEKTSNIPICCTRTWITNVRSYNCMRNGASIVSAKDAWITYCHFEKTNGKAPEAGIDIEPEGGSTLMQNVNVIACTGTDNAKYDFQLELGGNATPVTNSVGVTLSGCVARDSRTYTETVGFRIGNHKDTMANDGYVRLVDCKAMNINNHGLHILNIDKDGQDVEVINMELIDTALVAAGSMVTGFDTPCVISTNSVAAAYADPGGVRIMGLRIVDNTRDRTPYYVHSVSSLWTDVVIDDLDWINSVGETSYPYTDDGNDVTVTWVGEPPSVNRTSDITLSTRYSGLELTNLGAAGMVTFTLPAITAANENTHFDFYVKTAQVLRIDPDASDKIHAFGNGDGKYVQSSTVGTHILIKYLDADGWMMEVNKESAITAEP